MLNVPSLQLPVQFPDWDSIQFGFSGLQRHYIPRLKAIVNQAFVEDGDLGKVGAAKGYVGLHNFLTVSLHSKDKRKGIPLLTAPILPSIVAR